MSRKSRSRQTAKASPARTVVAPASGPAGGPLATTPGGRTLVPVYRHRFLALAPLMPYAAVLIVTLLLLVPTLTLWRWNILSPYSYEGDGALHLMFTKAFVENGWYLTNPFLGAPGEMQLYEFPAADALPGLIIKGIGLFTHDPALINNLFFLLTYPLSSLIAFAVCRHVGISRGPAMLVGVLYAFLPYHFYRNAAHLYLSGYFVAPLAVLVGWWIATGRLFPDGWRRPGRLGWAALLTLVVSLAGVYYPFFAGVVLGCATLLAWCARRDWPHFLAGGFLCAVLAGGLLAALSPSLWYMHTHPHPPASARFASETEIYGLKIIQLLLPVDGHRLHAFARFKQAYDVGSPLVTENGSAALGALGAVGFLGLIGWTLFRPLARTVVAVGSAQAAANKPRVVPLAAVVPAVPDHREVWDVFGTLNAALVLVGTIGGFGTVFAWLVSPQVRSLNRISVFIAFLSLAALAAGIDRWVVRRRRYAPAVRVAGWVALGLLLAAGVWDQTWPADVPYYKLAQKEYRADRRFFEQVQAVAPAGGMIFQLPYMTFPENGTLQNMPDYSHFRGYLHTHGLRWSYGAMRGSAADLWQQYVAGLPTEACVRELALGGFDGIYLERNGYADEGAGVEADLRRLLGAPKAWRLRRLYFSLAEYTQALRATMTPERWQVEREQAIHAPLTSFRQGFSLPESTPEHTWRWSEQDSRIEIDNTSNAPRRLRLRLLAQTGVPGLAHLTMNGAGGGQTWTINETLQPVSAVLELPPGKTDLAFHCDAPPVNAPMDRRIMVWSPVDFRLEEEDAPPTP